MKRLIILLFLLPIVFADTTIYLFYGQGCPHCSNEEEWLESLNIQGLHIEKYEVWNNQENQVIYANFSNAYNTYSGTQVPRTFIGDKVFIGFQETNGTLTFNEEYQAYYGYSNVMLEEINNCLNNGCVEPLSIVYNNTNEITQEEPVNNNYNIMFLAIITILLIIVVFKKN